MSWMRERDLSAAIAALVGAPRLKRNGRGSNRDLSKCGTRADAERLRPHSTSPTRFS